MARIRFRKDVSAGRIITKLIALVIVLFVGSSIINVVQGIVTDANADWNGGWIVAAGDITACSNVHQQFIIQPTDNPFTAAFQFLGFNCASSGIISVIGLILVASLALEFINVKL